MAEECTEAASGCVADAPPFTAAAPPGDVDMSDCPAAAVDPGAPLVTAGSAPRKDAAGCPACECWTRCKGKLHSHPPGKICHACWKIREGIRSSPSADALPAPAHSTAAARWCGNRSSDWAISNSKTHLTKLNVNLKIRVINLKIWFVSPPSLHFKSARAPHRAARSHPLAAVQERRTKALDWGCAAWPWRVRRRRRIKAGRSSCD